jgi:D-3-phosphoglycerate dehydrogenase
MRILAFDPHRSRGDIPGDVELAPLERLLSQADIVTLHTALDETTRASFGAAEFALMKTGAWFVNTARGELIDETALLASLQSGRLAGAALDVLADETSTGMGWHPLVAYARTHSNLLITPHIGGCTAESMARTECFLAERLSSVLADLSTERTPAAARVTSQS